MSDPTEYLSLRMLRSDWRQYIADTKRLRANAKMFRRAGKTIQAGVCLILADANMDAAARIFAAYVRLREELDDA